MAPPEGRTTVVDELSPAPLLAVDKKKIALSDAEGEAAIERFCQFLRFPTVSSIAAENGAYVECASWLKNELEHKCKALDDVFYLPEAPDHSPVVVALWKGRDESLPCILLNSHYDVVPAEDEDWTVPPFEGLRKDGRIYGRGSQDMKCVCLQYVEAISKLHALRPDWKPERNVYLTFVPDEGV